MVDIAWCLLEISDFFYKQIERLRDCFLLSAEFRFSRPRQIDEPWNGFIDMETQTVPFLCLNLTKLVDIVQSC